MKLEVQSVSKPMKSKLNRVRASSESFQMILPQESRNYTQLDELRWDLERLEE